MKKEAFEELLTSIRQGGAFLKGRAKPGRTFDIKNPNARVVRSSLGLSQGQFSRLLGISIGTLRNWEQGYRKPQGPARVLLVVAATHPEALVDVTQTEPSKGIIKKRGRGCMNIKG